MDGNFPHVVTTLDRQSFEELFRAYFSHLCSFAHKYVQDIDEAKDIVHHVFIGLWQKRSEIDMETPLKSYLFTGVHNRCLNHIRDRKKLTPFEAPLHESQMNDYLQSRDHLESMETESRINRALDQLPEKCREIFMMNRFENLKYREIAGKLNISVKTVETQMSRALKSLRENLSDLMLLLIIYLFHK
ncbi:MAG: RNA polymerase sigma-70 factor [Cyclobacteriaceae bacterium]|nr:RNA polymerase sigma-70 factor [Cyclobacteriaceae bacterium]